MFIYHSAQGLTGGGTTDLDSFASAALKDGNVHVCWVYDDTTKKVYAHVFDPDSTEAESSPDFVRPDDFGTSGVWVMMQSPFDVSAGIETGTVQIWTADPDDTNNPVALPIGYLECDGSAISRLDYAELFAVIGESYGVGDGVNTFNVPDYRGEFLRGFANDATANDPDYASRTNRGDGTVGNAIGTKQTSQNKLHSHVIDMRTSGWTLTQTGGGIQYKEPYTNANNTDGSGGSESRPRNVSVMFIIKY